MQIKISGKAIRLGKLVYQPGEVADVARSTARVLLAIRRAEEFTPDALEAQPVKKGRARRGTYNRRDVTP